jgi:hypothetical protein
MANAPFMFLDPFGEIPGSDHSVTGPLPGDIYARAAARYGDALFAAAAARDAGALTALDVIRFGQVLGTRTALHARPDYSVVSPTMGWAVLREHSADGRNMYARLDYGPHGGTSGHADKLALYLCGNGRRVMSDDDNYPASSPLRFGWAKQTLAHNTVVINYRSQLGAESAGDAHGNAGKLLLFDRTDGISVVEADARSSYPHAPLSSCRRCVALTPDYCIDVFTIAAVKPITADWVFHGLGQRVILENAIKGESTLGNPKVRESILGSSGEGYNWLDNVQTYIAHEQWSVAFTAGLRTTMMGQRDTRLLAGESGGTAEVVGEFVTQRTHTEHTVIARRQNVLQTRFIAVHEILAADTPVIESFTRLETGTGALVLEIMLPEYKDVFILQPLQKAQEMLIDQSHLVTIGPRRYAYGRFRRSDHALVRSANLTFKTLE